MKPIRVGVVALTLAIMLVGCVRYSGDGQFSDEGWSIATRRYVLDLGPLDLGAESTVVRRLAGLPPGVRFTVGIFVVEATPASSRKQWPEPTAVVRLTVVRSDGAVIITEQGPLNEWTRAHTVGEKESFLWRSGRVHEVPQGNGVMTYALIDVRPDQGWGSSFTPRAGAEYTLLLAVLSAQATSGDAFRLGATSGGWKGAPAQVANNPLERPGANRRGEHVRPWAGRSASLR